jgi:hypothetical protein
MILAIIEEVLGVNSDGLLLFDFPLLLQKPEDRELIDRIIPWGNY